MLAIVVLAIAWLIARSWMGRGSVTSRQWYYDVDARTLFVHDETDAIPIVAPSGGNGVRAYVYACGQCTDQTRRILYLEKPDSDRQATLVASTDHQTLHWVPLNSPEGIAISSSLQTLVDHCNNSKVQRCLP